MLDLALTLTLTLAQVLDLARNSAVQQSEHFAEGAAVFVENKADGLRQYSDRRKERKWFDTGIDEPSLMRGLTLTLTLTTLTLTRHECHRINDR